uniref:non-specific serine/threonine protein kinase n=1 Tax=Fagus sylvatica TaxID=28930 RepID=A0A2N9FXC5_FAGSY
MVNSQQGFFQLGTTLFAFPYGSTRPSVPTIVWMANRDDPVDGKGSKLSVLNEGKLILTNSVGITVWTTRTSALTSSEATNLQLQLLNTGNLVLHNSKSSFFIWQSFDSPTDTLLPQQALTMVSSLISKRSQDDYSSGNYKLFFDNDNVLRLLFQGPAMTSLYWPDPWIEDPGEVGRSKYNTSRNALLDDLGCFWSSDHFTFFANDYGVVTHRRLTLDPDGNLRLYSLKEMNGRWDWVVTWQVLSQPCTIHGICGPNKFSVSCNHTDESSFVQLEHVEYYGSDLNFTKNLTFELCQEKCWSFGCNCKGFQYKFIKEEGDFYLRVPKDGIFYNKTPHEEFKLACSGQIPKQQRRTYENKTVKLLLWFAIALGGVELTCIVMVWFFLLRTRKRPDPAAQGYLLTNRFQRFSFDELRKATRGFKEVIGQGAGGIVYKGVLPDQRVAAIKRLNEANQGESEFLAEVNTIGMLNHMYLIEMWGYCAEGKHKLLVYEYMEHGSLAGNLRSNVLDWKKRFDIAVDANYQPKVADFGLSKLLSRSNIDHSSFSKMRGTRGYMAPEWVYNLPITSKVDVYSYGIVLLEMVTGKSPSGMHISDNGGTREHKRLVTLVRENLDIENDITMSWIEEIIDPMMAGIYDKAKMELLVTVALQCVAEDKDDRPTMNQVVEMLLSHED